MPAAGFTFSLPYVIIPHTTHYTTKKITHSHPNLTFFQHTNTDTHPTHVTRSAQEASESKIDLINVIFPHSSKLEARNVQWVGIKTRTHLYNELQRTISMFVSAELWVVSRYHRSFSLRTLGLNFMCYVLCYIKHIILYEGGAKSDWDFRISALVKNPDGTDV